MNYQGFGPKVAIPRLGRRDHGGDGDHGGDHGAELSQNKPGKTRVQKACYSCRKRKVRCSGEQPQCQTCVSQQMQCTYPQARKDRLKDTAEQNSQLLALLRDLSVHVDGHGQQKIDQLLDSLGETAVAPTEAMARPVPSGARRDGPNSGGAVISELAASKDDLDLVNEDLFRSRQSRATGLVGQSSEVQWLRSLKTQMESSDFAESVNPLPYRRTGRSSEAAAYRIDASHARHNPSQLGSVLHVSDSTFYADSDELDVDVVVDPYELPLPARAEKLYDCYMQTVHTSFPILPDEFEGQFRRYNKSVECNQPYEAPKNWQAMLNLVLAIGAQYSHLVQAEWRADEKEHLIYMTRATRILGLENVATAFSTPTLSSIQATGLLSLYYATIGQVSRAWMMIGISLRFGLAVGLHLRNDDSSASPSKKEGLARTWWSLYCVENLLSSLIGRPCVIPNDQCTVALPLVSSGEQSRHTISHLSQGQIRGRSTSTTFPSPPSSDSSSMDVLDTVTRTSFLGARVTIGLIMQKALSKLYSPRKAVDSWEQVQREIRLLLTELDEWVEKALPGESRSTISSHESGIRRERLLLSFQYHSVKLLICRPCLCRPAQRSDGQNNRLANFNQKTAEACVQEAQAMTRLFPDEPNHMFIYQQSPWWCIVHNIMQAITVFLLELSFEETNITYPSGKSLRSIKKLLGWLRFMSISNVVAERAYKVAIGIVKTGAPQLRVDIIGGEEPNIDQDQSLQSHRPPGDTTFSSNHGNFFPQPEWGILFSNHPIATADFSIQYPVALGEGQPAQVSNASEPSHHFMSEPELQMPSVFANSFGLLSPLEGLLFLDEDATMNDG